MAAVTAPTTEIGYVQAPNYNWWLYDNETTPELLWPQSIAVYDAMRRTDAQVGSVLRAVTETLLRTPWRIDPAGARARVTKFVADDLGLPIVGKNPTAPPRSKDRFSWPAHLREALLMLPFGHSYFEQVYRVTDDGSAAHLRKLAYRPAKTLESIDVAADGGLVSIKQYWTTANREPQPIPVNRLVAYIHAKEGGNWLGTSILRNCYKNWLLKDRLLRVQAQTIERNGMGIPLYKAQEGATPDDIIAGKNMATAWRAGEAAGSAVPFGADLVLRGVEGTLPDAQPVVEYHDAQIARAVLAHFLNLGTQTGSWALGTTFADFFTMSLQTLAEQIRDTATQHVVEDLVDINFGDNEPAPRLVFDEIGSRQAATAQALKTLVDAGVIHPDQVLEESSRQQYGLPPADPATATPPPGAPATAPPAPTEMGDMSTAVAAMGDPKAVAAQAAPVEAKFNPAEPRDPHSGKWIDTHPGDGNKLGIPDIPGVSNIVASDFIGGDRGVGYSLDMSESDALFAVSVGSREHVKRHVDPRASAPGENEDLAALGEEEATKLRRRLTAAAKAADAGKPYGPNRVRGMDVGDVELVVEGDKVRFSVLPFGVEEPYQEPFDPDPLTEVHDYDLDVDRHPTAAEIAEHLADQKAEYEAAVAEHNAALAARRERLTVNLTGDEARKLAAALAVPTPDDPKPVAGAAGLDTHPGGEQLKHYWVYGEGAAKWNTWTELYHHLVKYLNPEMAKRTAAQWFHLRYGFWPGADVNRVKHGKPPRGHLVGPG